jgi:hypothetical protein
MNLKRGNSSAQPLVVKVKYEILPVSCREVHDVDVSGTLAGLGGGADHYVFAVGRSDTGVSVRQREEKRHLRVSVLAISGHTEISDHINVFKRACMSLPRTLT